MRERKTRVEDGGLKLTDGQILEKRKKRKCSPRGGGAERSRRAAPQGSGQGLQEGSAPRLRSGAPGAAMGPRLIKGLE